MRRESALPYGIHQFPGAFIVRFAKSGVLWLVIAIPVAAILMSAAALWVALADPDPGVPLDHPPLRKSAPHQPS
jgi:hypothetical protein